MEPNPYESPQAREPLKPAQIAKRGIGVLAIALLTPVAVGIVGFISCNAGWFGIASSSSDTQKQAALTVAVGLAVSWIPPLAVLVAMVWWAMAANRRHKVSK